MPAQVPAQAPSRAPARPSADPFVARAAGAVGGPLGRHAATGRRGPGLGWRPGPVLVVLTLATALLAWAAKQPCRGGWGGPGREGGYQYTHLCYTDVHALWFAERLGDAWPYVQFPVEYPPGIGAAMALGAAPVRLVAGGADAFTDLTTVLLAACALVVVGATARLAGARPWDAALVALAPSLVLHLLTNWDLVAVALLCAGLLAWARSRPVLCGVLLGLGAATKLFPALACVALLLLGLRAGRLRPATAATAVAAGVGGAALAVTTWVSPSFVEREGTWERAGPSPLSLLPEEGPRAAWSAAVQGALSSDGPVNAAWRFARLSAQRDADWDSLWLHGQRAGVLPELTAQQVSRGSTWAAVVVLLAVAVLVALAPRRPRLPQVLALLLIGVLLTAKVFSPQFTLWLLPVVVLALPRWRVVLAWQATEAALLVARMWMLAGVDPDVRGLPLDAFGVAVVVRDLALLVVAALVVRDVLRPEHDVVRSGAGAGVEVDDPAGGPLDGAPDRGRRGVVARLGRPVTSDATTHAVALPVLALALAAAPAVPGALPGAPSSRLLGLLVVVTGVVVVGVGAALTRVLLAVADRGDPPGRDRAGPPVDGRAVDDR